MHYQWTNVLVYQSGKKDGNLVISNRHSFWHTRILQKHTCPLVVVVTDCCPLERDAAELVAGCRDGQVSDAGWRQLVAYRSDKVLNLEHAPGARADERLGRLEVRRCRRVPICWAQNIHDNNVLIESTATTITYGYVWWKPSFLTNYLITWCAACAVSCLLSTHYISRLWYLLLLILIMVPNSEILLMETFPSEIKILGVRYFGFLMTPLIIIVYLTLNFCQVILWHLFAACSVYQMHAVQ